MIRQIALLLVSLSILLAGCGQSHVKIKLSDNPVQTKQEILKAVPLQTPISDARRMMEKAGFQCEMEENSDFMEGKKLHKNIDYLYCDKSQKRLVSRRWQVAIVVRTNKVQDVYVSTGLIGP